MRIFHPIIALFPLALAIAQDAPTPVTLQFRYQAECGDPTRESSSQQSLFGTVVSVESGNQVHLRVAETGLLVSVRLIALATPFRYSKAWRAAKAELAKQILGKPVVVVAGNTSVHTNDVLGEIHLGGVDVNFGLIELGFCKFKTPPAYSMSNYTACTYRQIEKVARISKRGVWSD